MAVAVGGGGCDGAMTFRVPCLGMLGAGIISASYPAARMADAIAHLTFSVTLFIAQAAAGRKYLFEHPVTATSWQSSALKELVESKGAYKINFDFCMAGMVSEDERGIAPAKKRTGIVTNSATLARTLVTLQCDGKHRHAPLVGGRAGPCPRRRAPAR